MSSRTDLLWDILESEACERYYIDEAEKPAFLLLSKYNPLSHGAFELYMNHVSVLAKCKSKKKAKQKILQMLSTAKKPLKLFKVDKYGRKRGQKQLFAIANGKGNVEEA